MLYMTFNMFPSVPFTPFLPFSPFPPFPFFHSSLYFLSSLFSLSPLPFLPFPPFLPPFTPVPSSLCPLSFLSLCFSFSLRLLEDRGLMTTPLLVLANKVATPLLSFYLPLLPFPALPCPFRPFPSFLSFFLACRVHHTILPSFLSLPPSSVIYIYIYIY